MIITQCKFEDIESYLDTFLIKAKQSLENFTYLKKIIQFPNKLYQETYENNKFLIWLSYVNDISDYQDIDYSNSNNYFYYLEYSKKSAMLSVLKKVDEILSLPEFENISDEFKNKFNSFENGDSFAVYEELILFNYFKTNENIIDLKYDNLLNTTTEKQNDFSFQISDLKYNLELTTIAEGEFEQILKSQFKLIIEEIYDLFPKNTYLKLDLDLGKTVLSESKKIPDNFHKLLLKELKKVIPVILHSNGNLSFNNNLGSNKTIYEYKDLLKYYSEFGESTLKLFQKTEFDSYLKTTPIKDLDICFTTSIFRTSKYKLIEIHTKVMFPSRAEEMRQNGIKQKLIRKIKEKITQNQLQNKQNPFILIKFNDTLYQNYSTESCFLEEHFEKLIDEIKQEFKENKDIIGVLLYENSISEGVYLIQNPNVNHKEKEIKLLLENLRSK